MMNIAIVGAGFIARAHARACHGLKDVSVRWVADQDISRAEMLAEHLGARATSDNAEAVSDPAIDAVIVAVPTAYHREVATLAARHGKNVFCEKPIALTLADAEAMIATCEEHGVRLMIGHVVRFFPAYARIYEMLRENVIGQVGQVRTRRVSNHPGADRPWYVNVDLSGGLIVDLMIHDLDTLRWYFGDIKRVMAHGLSYSRAQTTSDYALALVRFENGVIAQLEASWAHSHFNTAIEIAGEHGLISHASDDSVPIRIERQPGYEAPLIPIMNWTSPVEETPYQRELRHFFACLKSGEPFLTNEQDALRSLAAALAVLRSVRTGKPVHFTNGMPAFEEVWA